MRVPTKNTHCLQDETPQKLCLAAATTAVTCRS